MPIGTEKPNIYPTDLRLRRKITDNQGDIADVVGDELKVVLSNSSFPLNSIVPQGSMDAFMRLRIAEPYTIFDSKQIGDKLPLFYDDQEVTGGGTSSTYNADRSSTSIGVSNLTAGKRVRQTFQRFNYQPGKSQLSIFTFVFGTTGAGVTKEVGLFDDSNGLFLRNNGGTISFVRRTYISGAPIDVPILQANWNIDTFDGNGESGITLDFTKAQIFFADFEWLGVGTVRFGFYIDGTPYFAHAIHNANAISSVYMTTPNLPVRYSIENSGAGGAETFEHICSTVISEGGVQPTGIIRSIDRGIASFTTLNDTDLYPILSMRLRSGYEDITVFQNSVEIFTSDNANYRWALLLNPTVAGVDAAAWVALANSAIEYDVSRTTVNKLTGGIRVASGYGSSTNQSKVSVARGILNAIRLGTSIAGARDQLVLAVQNLASGTNHYYGAIEFRELL